MGSLVARGVTASYADVPVFDGIDLTVADGQRVGLVGPNGAGKSTLLKILAGVMAPEAGTVTVVGSVGYVGQEPDLCPGEDLAQSLSRRTGVAAAQANLDRAAAALATVDGESAHAADEYNAALEHWLSIGGDDLDARMPQVLTELGLSPALLTAGAGELSGGQKARASLAVVLLARFDVLLLDEPTNDLDLDGLARLEAFVGGLRGGLVVVSHDREFLARVVTAVLELDPANQQHQRFDGGWDAYLAERAVARTHARENYDEYAQRRSDLAGQMQNVREMSVRGAVRAKRRRPDSDKIGKAKRMEGATSAAGKVRNLENRLQRMDSEAVIEPRKEWVLTLELPAAPRSGELVSSVRGATVSRGAFRLGPIDVSLHYGDRVALDGANGSGKTTLLGLLLGRIAPDEGAITVGAGVVIGELDQVRQLFGGPSTVVDVLRAESELAPEEARTLLAKFGLRAAHVGRPASSLSPGERTRAGLALLMGRKTNLLVLDEPTNHLDLPAIEQLEQALTSYDGTLVLVSHDRRLRAAVPVARTWQLDAGHLTES